MLTEEDLRLGRGLHDATPLELKLWSRVKIIDDDDSCWLWLGPVGREPYHYGKINWKIPGTDKHLHVAHRAAFFVSTGRHPDICHQTCDNPPCCRPSHLIDRIRSDTDSRGRKKVRTANPGARMTEDLVRVARRLYRSGMSCEAIALSMGQGVGGVRFAVIGETWSHITDVPPVGADERRASGGKLTQAQIEDIKARRAAGESCSALAQEFGCDPSNISYLTRDKTKPKKKYVRVNLTDEQVRQIRLLRTQGMTHQGLADQFSINQELVRRIVNGRAYTHVK